MRTHINRQRATTRTRTAQALLGVLIIGGGAAMAGGLRPGPNAQAPSGKPSLPAVDLGQKTGPARNRAVDASGLAERLNQASNAPKIEAVAVSAGPEKPIVQPTPTQEIRYLGGVLGSRSMALVSDSGKQRFVAVGDSLGGGTVESITETAVRIAGDTPRTLDLVTRAGDTVTKGHAPARAQAGLRPAQPGSLAVVKQQPPLGVSLGAAPMSGQEIP